MKILGKNEFTFPELIVAMAVGAILLGIGVPNFMAAIKNNQLGAQQNALVSSLFLARSEATKGSTPITVCARKSDASCGNDWTNGWLVFVDHGTVAKIDAGDTILDVVSEIGGNNTIVAMSSPDPGFHKATERNFLRYSANGGTNWNNGTFTICDERGNEYARAINVVFSGDVRRGRKTSTSDVQLNVFGLAVTCPGD